MIDIGVNFQSPQLAPHTATLLANASSAGVHTILATGTSVKSSKHAAELAHAHPGQVFATAGLHPHHASHWSTDTEETLRSLLRRHYVVAAGELGLDYNRNFSTPAEQRRAFEGQLKLALECGKPLFLHCRDAFEDFLAILEATVPAGTPGVVHCFTDSWREAEAYLRFGLDIGITGWVTDLKRAEALRAAVPHLPLTRIHLETDAPYLSPKTAKGRRAYNEPANLIWVAREVAFLKKVPEADVIQRCTENSRRLFKIP